MITVLLLVSIIINNIFFMLLYNKNKELSIANRMRIGYEKRCNSFRIRYTILSRLEGNDKIKEKLKLFQKDIYIYGKGVIGNKLYSILCDDSEIRLLGFIDSKMLENDALNEIKINKNAVIIVTPVFDYDNIVNLLSTYTDNGHIVSIDEIL